MLEKSLELFVGADSRFIVGLNQNFVKLLKVLSKKLTSSLTSLLAFSTQSLNLSSLSLVAQAQRPNLLKNLFRDPPVKIKFVTLKTPRRHRLGIAAITIAI